MIFICPKCKAPLLVSNAGCAVCAMRHSFDRSKEGYYNLLLTNTASTHGDNKEMVLARRQFLNTGAYLPLAQRIFDVLSELCFDSANILDAGCGEGYYTDYLEKRLSDIGKRVHFSGFDISKEAVKAAAKKNRQISFAVAGSYHMPIADSSVDMLLNLFAPLALAETQRVIKSGGYFIMAIPAEKHLFTLKSKIYDSPYENTVEDSALEGFSLIKSERVSFTLSLKSQNEIRNLFMMTPYAYRTGKEARERILSLESLDTEADFIIFVYKKV